MAEDHRYSWLDDSAAERLLSGEPVEGQQSVTDDRHQPCAEAERLAAVLSAVAEATRPVTGPGATPLPGEDAAVSAFLAAREEFAAAAAGAEGSTPGREGFVRALRRGRFGARRQVRAGMVAALAGCALSGFAVAAAAGVLPTPFTEGGGPAPSVSMPGDGPSASDPVQPEISRDPTTPQPGPSGSTDNDASDPSANGGQGSTAPDDKDGRRGSGRDKGDKGHPSDGSAGDGRHTGPWALRACHRYLSAEYGDASGLDRRALYKLKKSAGRTTLHGYCVQLLLDSGVELPRHDSGGKDDGGQDGDGGSDGSGDGGSDGDGSGGSGGSGGGDGGSGGSGGHDPEPPPPTPSAPADTPADTASVTGDPV
ncbi:hypothetical protein [Streptomyces cucumeris]|uniref:hypothetical protein n=1 Tax=Streptomyces cucumeris TaxID=2962890 RepID=UPI0020C85AA1|nr:hypothetical protein [Streptomyces sp. NEAU-Y11]MCP9209113.1 hypothetical protein [Streptomyces sp. NEAU-Y11]